MNPGTIHMQGYLIGAAFLLLFGIAFAIPVFVPRLRSSWGDDGNLRMSAFAHIAWALFAFASAIILAAEDLHMETINQHGMLIGGSALGVLFLTALLDIFSRRNQRP